MHNRLILYVEVTPGDWHYLIAAEGETGQGDWRERADAHGPFTSMDEAKADSTNRYGQAGCWHEQPYIEGAELAAVTLGKINRAAIGDPAPVELEPAEDAPAE